MNNHLANTNDTSRNRTGIVYKKTIASYEVHTGEQTIACALSPRIRKQFGREREELSSRGRREREMKFNDDTDPVAIGDQVSYLASEDGTGVIVEVLPRRTKLARKTPVPMPSARPFEQVIVANLDQVVPVFAAANPVPKWNMLDRYLVSAEAAGLPALVCITKLDLAADDDQELWEAIDEYRRVGYPVILTSVTTGQGIDELRQALQGRMSVLLGKSGVGKSSLLNAMQPGLGLRVNEVSQVTGKGKHTTTHLQMFPLEFGGALVDTPGVREFGLWDVDGNDLALYFPEMQPFLGRCKFGLGCRHDEEPGCAIRKAVTAGQISPRRYHNYLNLKSEL